MNGEKIGRVNYMTRDEKLELKYKNQLAKRGYYDIEAMNIDTWFIHIMSKILKDFKKFVVKMRMSPNIFIEEFYELNKDRITCSKDDLLTIGYLLDNNLEKEMDDYAHNRWISELGKMIFLFMEANEETCSMKNPYNRAYTTSIRRTTLKEIKAKEEKTEYKASKRTIEHRKKLFELWRAEEDKLEEYMDKCKKEALEMFVKYFDHLWC